VATSKLLQARRSRQTALVLACEDPMEDLCANDTQPFRDQQLLRDGLENQAVHFN